MLYVSIGLIIISVISYQIIQRNTPAEVNPGISLMISYLIAFILSACLLFIFPIKDPIQNELKKVNIYSVLLGITIVGIELGYLLLFRNGGKISITSTTISAVTITALLLIGYFFFNEGINAKKIIGIALCIGGVFLLNK